MVSVMIYEAAIVAAEADRLSIDKRSIYSNRRAGLYPKPNYVSSS